MDNIDVNVCILFGLGDKVGGIDVNEVASRKGN
ncbi:hypothetical protein Pan161_52770 [Gimesia algae]|uniref:Uncharacterized protein n=1 Tax=Gimesia algae TaxID=2527971 RepID=A0A517VKQ0_9PLAN|nr:hypothetical protein Pan161_52770 [Gimesia algae]